MINYDPHNWRSHLFDIHGSMIREISARVATCALWGLGVVSLHFLIVPHGYSLAIPETAHGLVSVALGLLLVFRTNASYDRFWEGRKLWGSIVNASRNLARSSSVHLKSAPHILSRLLDWTSTFAWATLYRLRGERTLAPNPAALPVAGVVQVMAEHHVPLAVSRRMSDLLVTAHRQGLITEYVLVALEQNVQLLIDCLGACERIHNTRIPFAYMVHLRRALILYCHTLPFALLDRFGWGTPLVVLLVAYTLYGIEEIGVEIEDPFGKDENDLPLEQICSTIESDLRGVVEAVAREQTSEARLPATQQSVSEE
ncbi:MAG: bestrophin family protein [Planctomycetales bacterium]